MANNEKLVKYQIKLVFFNLPFEQRLNPARHTLTVAIKKCQDVSCGIGGTNKTSPNQPFSFVGADEPHALEITDVIC